MAFDEGTIADTFATPNILRDPKSLEAKERAKWEAQHSEWGPGRRPYVKRDYPMMIHLAGRPETGLGKATIIDTVIITHDGEYEPYRSRGFRPTPLEALEAWQAQETEYAELAAGRNWDVAHGRHSERAQREIAAAEAVAVDHLPSVPVTPIKPRAQKDKE